MQSVNNIRNTRGIAKNTVFLYFRSIVVMAVGIYTSRVVLQTLGVEDYGIYNVVGGFVSMFSILSASMVNASQRFISYEMGRENPQMSRVFCGTVSIHIILAIIILVFLETFGLWFLNSKLNIGPERLYAANWVFQCSVLSFCINLICVPYNACIIAHEKMNVFAYISIYEAFVKLGIVYLLWISGFDKLILYALLLLSLSISLRLIYGAFCKRNFDECRFRFFIDKSLIKEMSNFIGWNFFGSTAGILSTQGINVLINLFFGVVLNAARGLAEQVNQAINTFVNNFMTAMNPQIIKSYASGDYDYMRSLMINGAKYSAILFVVITLPIFIEAENILKIWLVEVPDYAVLFLKLTIVYSIFRTLANPIYAGMIATGNIRKYQIVMGSLYTLSFVLCYFFFTLGLGPEFSYISLIIIACIQLFVRLELISEIIPGFSKKEFFSKAIIKSSMVILFSYCCIYLVKSFISISNKYLEVVFVAFVSVLIVLSISYLIALTNNERKTILSQIRVYFRKLI